MNTVEVWAKGLLAAVVHAAATSVSALIVTPDSFDHSAAGWTHLAIIALVSAVLGAAGYLKQSPIPGVTETEDSNAKSK